MGQFRCSKCKQLQFKHKTKGEKVEIEVKCYSCNHFNYFTVWLSKVIREVSIRKYEKNNKQK